MKRKALRSASLLLAGALAPLLAATARAAVTESEFPPKTVREFVAICTPAKDDPMMTGAVNYCHGFAEGAVIVEMAHEKQHGVRQLFCLPSKPFPPSDAELASFSAWANEDPARLDRPAVDGLFLYLATKFPCGKSGKKK
jgi:hypothetical protein